MTNRLPALALAAAAASLGFSVAFAQSSPAAPEQPTFAVPPYKNLQVLPKAISRDQLLSGMRLFAQSLGVRCTHCHVGEEGKPLSTFDFASDSKPTKETARKMLAMVHRINQQDFGVTEFAKAKVTCVTCHRGSTKPATMPPPRESAPTAPASAKAPERG